ncbi:MAG TPA: L-rhamnose isomerase [Phycisphaerae bacterium]|nr:L-rhamnose isomerase [Phycisphaerae bacterium]
MADAYSLAREEFASWGVDTEKAMAALAKIPISLNCWQGDDVGGFESDAGLTGGGIQATGNYPGKARSAGELMADLELVFSCLPSRHRLSLHSIYADYEGPRVPRDELEAKHFKSWIDFAKQEKIGLDFNPTCFSHPMAADGFTLANRDKGIRQFWIRHCIACREIGAAMGKALKNPCVTNVWIPDGYKDTPADRLAPRQILEKSLDAVFAKKISPSLNLDAVEGKLFGIGSESYTVGSHEFYLGYAVQNKKLVCLDAGHYYPTETIVDKISSVLMHVDEILLHVSRGVRWDSDHVVILDDSLRDIAREIIIHGFAPRVHIGLDFFDASINRVAAWVIGTRAMIKALLIALLEPTARLREVEEAGDYTARLALMEEIKTLPAGAVWDRYCEKQGVPIGRASLDKVKSYEKDVLSKR